MFIMPEPKTPADFPMTRLDAIFMRAADRHRVPFDQITDTSCRAREIVLARDEAIVEAIQSSPMSKRQIARRLSIHERCIRRAEQRHEQRGAV